jgi:hypothetical protein
METVPVLLFSLAVALWFFYESLKSFLAWFYSPVPKPPTPFILFVYCLFAGIIVLYYGGWLERLRG